MTEYRDGVQRWDLLGVNLTHFDGHERPIPVLDAVIRWLGESNVAPNKMSLNCVWNSDIEAYEYTATVEWDSYFVVK